MMDQNPNKPFQISLRGLLLFFVVCGVNLALIRGPALLFAVYAMVIVFIHLVTPDWFLGDRFRPMHWPSLQYREDGSLRKYTRLARIVILQIMVVIAWAIQYLAAK